MGKKEYIKGEFTNEEMREYLQMIYIYEGAPPMVENIKTPFNCYGLSSTNLRKRLPRSASRSSYKRRIERSRIVLTITS